MGSLGIFFARHYREQRELYEAAKIIQTAYRQYKARITNQKQLDAERTAAVVIQSYYRRYKQFCYFKKLHKAAVLIQKHFRLNKANKQAENPAGDPPSNPSCIRLEVPPNANVQVWRQHLAAMRIQHAFRGHYMRKRQAAARKIQKFMRESKQKLRKVHKSSGRVCTPMDTSETTDLETSRIPSAPMNSQTGCPHN
uniref:Calmodulin binding transcription activator 1 n=1 Tax=Plectus sambesii TaxID=2011161 RepID=A0A914XST5_9BILA